MARKKKDAAASKEAEINPLLDALKFVSVAQMEIGITYQTHCSIGGGFVSAFNGMLAAGAPYEEDFTVAPHTFRLIDALERVKGSSALSILPTNQINVKDDKRFDAMVPCVPAADVQRLAPDAGQWPITDAFKRAAAIAGLFTAEGATTVVGASLLTRDGSIVGTNGICMIEVWHGVPMPPGLTIPKSFFSALAKINKPLAFFGFSDTSFTVWFEDRSYLRTQVYSDPWPNIDNAFNYFTQSAPTEPPPKDLYDAIRAVTSFSGEGRFYMSDGLIHSHRDQAEGARYACPGVIEGQSFVSKFVLALEPYIKQIDFNSPIPVATFYGDEAELKIRGVISKSN